MLTSVNTTPYLSEQPNTSGLPLPSGKEFSTGLSHFLKELDYLQILLLFSPLLFYLLLVF